MDRNEDGRDHAPDRARRELLHDLLSPWRRRGRRLLQIGGSPLVPPSLFWEAGFDAVCIESGPDILNAAREESGQVVEYTLGQPDSLPFEDDSFDYAVLPDSSSVLPSSVPRGAALRAVVAEAVRVASHGVIMVSANPLAPANWKRERGERGVWPWDLWLAARRAAPGCRVTLRGVCRVPLMSGRQRTPAPETSLPSGRNARFLTGPLPLGAAYGLRIGWTPLAGTPVGALRVPGLAARPREAAMSSSGLAADGAACPEAEGTDGR